MKNNNGHQYYEKEAHVCLHASEQVKAYMLNLHACKCIQKAPYFHLDPEIKSVKQNMTNMISLVGNSTTLFPIFILTLILSR